MVPDGTHDWMSFLDDFVCGDQGLERLNFIGQYWLNTQPRPEGNGGVVVPGVDDAFCKADAINRGLVCEYHGHALLTCFCFGADSSGLTAFLMWTTSSPSALSLSTGRVG